MKMIIVSKAAYETTAGDLAQIEIFELESLYGCVDRHRMKACRVSGLLGVEAFLWLAYPRIGNATAHGSSTTVVLDGFSGA